MGRQREADYCWFTKSGPALARSTVGSLQTMSRERSAWPVGKQMGKHAMSSCSFGMIQWCQFDWQSFATLTTGLAAVLGAVIVGWKQVGIADRQANISEHQSGILGRQVDLEETKLRAELFQRRLETFEITADFILHIMELPQTDEADTRTKSFCSKMRESQFLFSNPEVYPTLVSFWEKGNDVRLDLRTSRAEHENGIKHNPERTKRLMEYPIWALNTVETLADLFRADLAIGMLTRS